MLVQWVIRDENANHIGLSNVQATVDLARHNGASNVVRIFGGYVARFESERNGRDFLGQVRDIAPSAWVALA